MDRMKERMARLWRRLWRWIDVDGVDGEERKKIYISGPIAHHDLRERMAYFEEQEQRLRRRGWTPVNPMKNGVEQMEGDANWQDHMRADIRLLMDCDAIYMCEGWWRSKGCRLELDVAVSCGIMPVWL